MRRFAGMDTLTTWYTQMNADKVIAGLRDPVLRADAARTASRATSRNAAQAAAKLTVVQDGRRAIIPRSPRWSSRSATCRRISTCATSTAASA